MDNFSIIYSPDPTDSPSPKKEESKMARYKRFDYNQAKLLPVSFHKQIQPRTFEFTLSYLIDNKVDLSVFEDLYCNDETGAPTYDPSILLKIILLAYSRGIISSRDIARACEENIVFMTLSADTQPHFTTISNFITKMKTQVLDVFSDVLLYCDEVGLIGKNMFAIDGCKLPSNASKEWSGTHEGYKRKVKKMKKAVAFILEKYRNADDGDSLNGLEDQEQKYIDTLNRRIEKIEKFIKTNRDKIGKSGKAINSNITDNDSAKMKTSHGVIQGYDGVVAVDDKNQVIVHAQAFGQAQEHDLLKPMIDGARESLAAIVIKDDICKKAKWTADTGFHNEANMKMLYDENIDAYIADNQFRKRDPRFAEVDKYKERSRKERSRQSGSKRRFRSSDFKFPNDLSYCICPAGKRLYRNGANTYLKGLHSIRFRGSKCACVPCHLRTRCMRDPKRTQTRQVAYFTGRPIGSKVTYSRLMKEKIDSENGRAIYSKRIRTVEPVFANIRYILKLNRFTLRGDEKVNIQWKLFSIVHNMLRIHRMAYASGSG